MAYFAVPYRVLFHDTMAQGSHHFLTNFKFQCQAREHFFFGLVNEPSPAAQILLDTLDLVTLDAYSRNLAPVTVGETVGILMSVEDQTPSAFRLCFRVVRQDGKPVACGFQSVLCTVRQTGQVMVSPEPMYAFAALKERSRRPSFRDRVLAGGAAMKELFDEDAVRIATSVAAGYEPKLVPDILLPPTDQVRQRAEPSGIVFLFPGQGSWEPAFLRSLQSAYPHATPMLQRMDRVSASLLGRGFLAACGDQAEATRLLNENPDVVQVGIFAAGVVAARYLIDRGVKPALLLGHSFGELTSLAVGGALDEEAGAELVCHRVRSLQGLKDLAGGMLAVFADETRTRALVESLAPSSLEIAVINHAAQTVVSGTSADLQRLSAAIAQATIVGAPLKSRYPFHSALLRDAVEPFGAAIARIAVRPLHTAVYSSVDRGLYARVPDLSALPHHFVRPAIFDDAVESAYAFGGRVFIECSGGRVLSGLVKEILRGRPGVATLNTFAAEVAQFTTEPAPTSDVRAVPPPAEPPVEAPAPSPGPSLPEPAAALPADGPEPIAIVATGCVLPGAGDPSTLWRRLLARQGGIVDLGELDPTLAEDFKAARRMTPDKTYSLLCGHVNAEARHADEALLGRLDDLPTVGRFFAQAASQCVASVASPLPAPSRICCVVGSTADGSREMDEALVLAGVEARVKASQAPASVIDALSSALEHGSGRSLDGAGELSCPRAFARVSRALFGPTVGVLAVDAACASSLYAIDIGVDALREGRCDVALCGGAFAPGPASTCLFAQFQGLSAIGSHPLDASADGVVFGEGAALVMLKRLSDAVAAGDRIHAVIRAVASSSDGKSASVMEPKPGGQLLAIRRAADRAGISPSTLQFIDAHATATPVGDAVEFTSLREAVGPPAEGRHRVRVGSLKAAIGHTGWVAGAASVVEVCQALAARSFPPQLNFSTPNPKFNLATSNITIQADPSTWPANVEGLPRRAGVNGFGFGGCNAHVVLEEFDKTYHATGARPPNTDRTEEPIAIVGVASAFPKSDGGARPRRAWRFSPEEVRLPPSVRILPDVADHMDAGHVLAIRTAQSIVESLPKTWEPLRPDTGVVIGFDGKTRRAIDALLPIYRTRLARRFREARAASDSAAPKVERFVDAALDEIGQMPASGPYTLGGAMPNVTAGRVANTLNLNGPNLVLDAEGASLYQALAYATRQLRSGACRFMLAGGISTSVGADVERVVRSRVGDDGRALGEAAIMLGLTAASTAKELGLPILGYLSATDSTDGSAFSVGADPRAFLMGAEGALEVNAAVTAIREGAASATVRWDGLSGAEPLALTLTAAVPKKGVARTGEAPSTPAAAVAQAPEPAGTPLIMPLRWATPRWVPARARSRSSSVLTGRRVLVLTDQPTACLSPAARAALGRYEYRVVCPSDRAVPGGLAIDLASDAQAIRSVQQLDAWPYDAIVILANVDGVDPVDGLTGSKSVSGGLLDLMFVVSRHAYERIGRGDVAIGAICLSAVATTERVHPLTGLISGFLRSLAIELPSAPCSQVNVSDADLGRALDELEAELASSTVTRIREVCIDGDQRFVQQLMEGDPVSAGSPTLARDSVVVATGGARGVTAVLVEAIRREYGCTTVLLGRTEAGAAPADILAMDDGAFERFEGTFYQRELAARPGTRPADLKATYRHYRAVREAAATLDALAALPGAIEYIRTDVTDGAQVDAAVQQIVAKFGRIDLIIHGAGIQTSKALRKKRVEDFRGIVATKLGGLGHLIQSCRAHIPGRRPHWHLVTSTFSYSGNDGQQDYGAANLAMDRLAAFMDATGGELDASTLGWIGWVNVGMTKGSEYANLAIQRRLGGVTREKGKARFREFMGGRPSSPVTYVITDLELAYFGTSLTPADRVRRPVEKPRRVEQTLLVDTDVFPFLKDHTVNDVPTLPAAFGLELAARVASTLRPGLDIERYLAIKVDRFVKVPGGRSAELRGVAEILEETDQRCHILVRLLSDFSHASGRILQRDILHMSTEVLMGTPAAPTPKHGPLPTVQSGWRLADPYLHAGAPVRLGGPFQSLEDIQLTPSHTTAVFKQRSEDDHTTISGLFVPFVLLDALWRMAAMRREDDGMAPVYVPLGCDQVEVLKGIDQSTLAGPCFLTSSVPRVEGDRVRMDWAEATDPSGRVLVTLSNLIGASYGRVPAEVERLRPPRLDSPGEPRANATVAPAARAAGKSVTGTLDGKVAFVSGSGRGLGKVVAMKLADQGAFVVVNSFHSRERGEQATSEIVARGGRAIHVWGSVAQPAQLSRMFEEIDAAAGGLDFMVSNASAGVFAPIDHFTDEQWMRSFRTNVVALHQSALMAAERMRRRGGGSIVALSSIGTKWCFEKFALVGPVKAAVESLVRYLAVELESANVQVSAVAAGAIDGELLRQHPKRPRWESLAPNGRLLTEDEVADAVIFLLTTGGFNGATMVVDGGSGLRTMEPVSAQVSQGGQS